MRSNDRRGEANINWLSKQSNEAVWTSYLRKTLKGNKESCC